MKLTLRAAGPLLVLFALVLAGARPGSAQTGSAAPAKPAPAASAHATQSGRLDGIAAVVNDDVILESDVEEQLYLFLLQARARPDAATVDTLRRQVLDQLIDFKLIVAEAKRQGLSLTASDTKDIARQVEESLKDTKGRFENELQFREMLAKENTTEAKLREKYRTDLERQLLAQKLVDRQLPKKTVTKEEAEAYFTANPGKFPKVPAEAKLQVIQIPITADSVAEARGKSRAIEARKRLVAGDKFAKLAGELSEDATTAHAGGDLGYIPRGALDRPLDEAAFSLKSNEISSPVRSAAGWHVVQVLERDTLKTAAGKDSVDRSGRPALEAHVRHILIRVPIGDDDVARARKLAERVRAEAVRGGDFGALVKRYSKYDGQATPDGDIGFISMAVLQPAIRAGLDTVKVGQISDVLENAAGLNIFKVNDRKPERPYTLDEVRDELPEAVAQIRQRERYETWVKGLRSKAHIEIRSS